MATLPEADNVPIVMLADTKALRGQVFELETKITKQQKDIVRLNKKVSK